MKLDKSEVETTKALHEAFKALEEGYLAQKERDYFLLTRILLPVIVACIVTTGAVVFVIFKFAN